MSPVKAESFLWLVAGGAVRFEAQEGFDMPLPASKTEGAVW